MVDEDDPTSIPDSFWMGIMGPDGRQDPFPYFATLGGPACSHAAAHQALRDPRFIVTGTPPSDRQLWHALSRWLISLNGKEHAALRRRISRAFTKSVVASYRPHVEATVVRLLDDLAPRGEAELVHDFALQLPTAVITDLMALPADACEGIDDLLIDLGLGFVDRDDPAAFDRGEAALHTLLDRLRPVLEERLVEPGDDLISRLLRPAGEDDDDPPVSFEDLLLNAVFLLQAGQESTQNTIASAVYSLLSNPDQLELLRADPDVIDDVVEETLRLHSAIGVAARVASADADIDRWSVKAGSSIPFFLGAVNRDPAVFDDPDRFELRRPARDHLAFAAGAHHCLGAPLARLEIRLALAGIFERLPGLRLVEEPRWRGVVPFRGLEALHVTWTPPG